MRAWTDSLHRTLIEKGQNRIQCSHFTTSLSKEIHSVYRLDTDIAQNPPEDMAEAKNLKKLLGKSKLSYNYEQTITQATKKVHRNIDGLKSTNWTKTI